jgi:hypothetical protein
MNKACKKIESVNDFPLEIEENKIVEKNASAIENGR